MTHIYLDHNASTPMLPQVLEAWQQFAAADYGNPASLHQWGRRSRQAIDNARAQIASLIDVPPQWVFFTSGGTEANHWALKGMPKGRLYLSPLEHSSLVHAAENSGHQCEYLPVDRVGYCSLEGLSRPDGISVQWASNETGLIQDISSIVARARAWGAWVHSDAVQALGKVPISFIDSGLHLMSLSAHKIGGPLGVGALVVDPSLTLHPLFEGGTAARSARAGAENLWGIIGFGVAAQWMQENQQTYALHLETLRDAFEAAMLVAVPEVVFFSQGRVRLPNTTFFGMEGLDAQMLVMHLDKQGIGVSGGAACGSPAGEVSHVLRAMGVTESLAVSAIRVSFGATNTMAEVAIAVREIAQVVQDLKQRGRR